MRNAYMTDELEAIYEQTVDFVAKEVTPHGDAWEEAGKVPREVLQQMGELGMFGLRVPEEHGGLGLGVLDTILVLEEINYACSGFGTIHAVNDLAATPLLIAGNDEQKKEYLGRLINDFKFAAYGLTEPGSGSDAASISTTYREEGDSYVLNGSKIFISNGSIANWMIIFATRDKSLGHKGISCFVVDADTPGLTTKKMTGKLGQRASDTAEIYMEDCRIPKTALVGEEGEGFKIAMRTFDRTRPQIVACSIGIGERALDECKRYALERQQFGQPIANFQGIQFMLADMAIEVEAMRLLAYRAAWEIDHGAGSSIFASYAKAFGADRAMQIATNAVQVFGGYGYMKEYPVEKLMRDAKLVQVYEGTSQVQRMVIARNLLRT